MRKKKRTGTGRREGVGNRKRENCRIERETDRKKGGMDEEFKDVRRKERWERKVRVGRGKRRDRERQETDKDGGKKNREGMEEERGRKKEAFIPKERRDGRK